MFDLYEEFKSIIAALEGRGIDYAVCGGLAMAVHGLPRATVDIDLMILAEDLEAVKDSAKKLGYAIEAMPMTFAKGAIEIRCVSKIDPETGIVLSLDLLLVTPQIVEIWATRTQVDWEEGVLSVLAPKGLIELKSFRGSGQDLDDIKTVARACMNVDMSAKAVTARLKLVAQLRRLCLALAKAKPVNSGPTNRAIDNDVGARPSPKRVLE